MRITSNITADNAVYYIQQAREQLDATQEKIASGLNINTPSEDPISTRTLLDLDDKINSIDQYTTNITKSTTWLEVSSTALTGMADILAQAKELVATISSGSTDASDRQNVNDQLETLKKQIVDMGNTQLGDQYIFGGFDNASAPFSNGSNDYAGDSSQIVVDISQSSSQAINITGDRLLKGTGTDPSYGTTDILQAFDDLMTAVGDSTHESDPAAIQAGAQALEAGAEQITNAQVDVASRLTRLESMTNLHTSMKNSLQTIAGTIQNADIAKLGVELSQQQTAFEATLSATAKISELSLLDYL